MKHSSTPIFGGRYHTVGNETVPMAEQQTDEHRELHKPEPVQDEVKPAPEAVDVKAEPKLFKAGK